MKQKFDSGCGRVVRFEIIVKRKEFIWLQCQINCWTSQVISSRLMCSILIVTFGIDTTFSLQPLGLNEN